MIEPANEIAAEDAVAAGQVHGYVGVIAAAHGTHLSSSKSQYPSLIAVMKEFSVFRALALRL